MATRKTAAKPVVGNSESLGDDAYDWLVAAIASFTIPTNSQISENKLAAQLGFSRTPVREALKRLESEGLVKRGEAGRYTVAMLTAQDVDNALDVLQFCDAYMFKKAAENLTPADTNLLKSAAKTMASAAKSGDREGWMEQDQIFHDVVMRNCQNVLVSDFAKMTRRRIQRFWARSSSAARDLITCSDEHIIIAEAIIDNDSKAIETAVTNHLGHLRTNMHEIVAATKPFF